MYLEYRQYYIQGSFFFVLNIRYKTTNSHRYGLQQRVKINSHLEIEINAIIKAYEKQS